MQTIKRAWKDFVRFARHVWVTRTPFGGSSEDCIR